jgi:hypothetical protein
MNLFTLTALVLAADSAAASPPIHEVQVIERTSQRPQFVSLGVDQLPDGVNLKAMATPARPVPCQVRGGEGWIVATNPDARSMTPAGPDSTVGALVVRLDTARKNWRKTGSIAGTCDVPTQDGGVLRVAFDVSQSQD